MEKNCALCNREIMPGNLYYKWADNYICSACGARNSMANINDALGGILAIVDDVIETGLVNQTDSTPDYQEGKQVLASEYGEIGEFGLVNQTEPAPDYQYTRDDIKNARAIINAIKALGYYSDSEFSQAVAGAVVDNAENAEMLKSLHTQLYGIMAHPHYDGNPTLDAMWHQWEADDNMWDAENGIDYSLSHDEFIAIYGDDIEAMRQFGLVNQTESSGETYE